MKRIIYLIIIGIFIASFQTKAQDIPQIKLDSLKMKLETLFMKDQIFRRMYKDVEKRYGQESDEIEYFWEVVEKQDKVLEKEVVAIIEKYGWLGISQVGRLANTTIWGVLQHGSVASKEKYAPLLKESVLLKESQPKHYARLIDRMLINSDKPQLYGSQFEYGLDGKATFFPIKDPETVNKRRQDLGLNTIQEFAKQKGIELGAVRKTK